MMKHYHVYGIGNALLDLDFEVSNDSLARLNVAKGLMTLIDEERHHQLLEDLDGIKHLKACGGSAANTCITLAQLGGQGFYSCKVAADPSGDFFFADLQREGLDTNLSLQARTPGVTGKCIVMVTPDADRTMNTYLGVSSSLARQELIPEAIAKSDYIYIEGFLVASPPSLDAAIAAKAMAEQAGVKTSLTLSDPNMVMYYRTELELLIGRGVDLLFCNEREAQLFCGTDDLEEIKQHLQRVARSFVITLGGKGAVVVDQGTAHWIKPFPAHAIDTVGAGDAFAGAFLYGITHGYSPAISGEIASLAGAQVVGKFGPRLSEPELEVMHKHLEKLAAEKTATI